MNRKVNFVCFALVLPTLAALNGCSSKPPAGESKKAAPAPFKIQGKLRVLSITGSTSDSSLNGGGPSIFVWEGRQQYRLFSRRTLNVTDEKEYIVEGIHAQKAIDEIGDPDQGKGGYPLLTSCERVVKTAWPGMSFEEVDVKAAALRGRVSRYPARPIILVTRIQAAPSKDDGTVAADKKKAKEEEDLRTVTVPADKQKALLIEGTPVQPAPLWEPAGGTIRCKVIIGSDGKISELETGAQLCEAAPWAQFRYQAPVQGGHPVKVATEVEVRYEPRK
ncbi:hypothetical protein [uncultured Paludibaculum sp.]|uniref:hypothetical protein n=1 Tax=uncultured Paludibaculum sp. TaxID=1765020 RepID=UPI002AAC3382|nr:hypothetical protein [uncultured Paludibaculum sp.]